MRNPSPVRTAFAQLRDASATNNAGGTLSCHSDRRRSLWDGDFRKSLIRLRCAALRGGGTAMLAVADYRRFADECRRLAATLTKPADKRAMELMANGWDKTADQCVAKLVGDLVEAMCEPRQPTPVP